MNDALLTDLYQLTMLEAYQARDLAGPAVFELYARRLPADRGFLMVAGLEQALDYLEALRFTPEAIDWLASTGRFSTQFLASLAEFRFTGSVWAVPEGTILFAGEPWLRVEAPLPEAQLVESRLINLMHLSTLIATKAARCVLAAADRPLFDFGMRRAHGAEAAVLAARVAMIAGFSGTATVEAGRRFQIPIVGTMAHAYVQAFGDERSAFLHYAQTFPGATTLLIDTYDTSRAAHIVAELVSQGVSVQAVRIDSGDLAVEAQRVRDILDAGGATEVGIVATGNLDEYAIEQLLRHRAPIDAFGVGTRLDTSSDAPTIDAVYKLESYAGEPRRKRSVGKETWPGAKQIWRSYDSDGLISADCIALEHEFVANAVPLLQPVMRNGRRLGGLPSLQDSARKARAELATLPQSLRSLHAPAVLSPRVSDGIHALAARADRLQQVD
jgi:nicotinate phosphoribosyltransferase